MTLPPGHIFAGLPARAAGAEQFLDGRVILHCGDCRDVLPTLAENLIDACVTDPPYSLVSVQKRFGKPGSAPCQYGTDGRYQRASAGFMGSTWDTGETAFDPAFWTQVLRVMKPGAHLLACGGTRTYHRLVCAIEDAGFEIRDCIVWAFGQGFPKSHDVSKGIDKTRDGDKAAVRVICRHIRHAMDTIGLKSKDLVKHFDDCHPRLIDHWAARDTDSQPTLPTWRQWQKLQEILSIDCSLDEEVLRLNERKGEPSDDWKSAAIVGEYNGEPGGFGDHRFSFRDKAIRAPSDLAAQWFGWGTALKPAIEPICLARKPLIGTIAENVLAHGTGALNIDGCRVLAGEDHQKNCDRNNVSGIWRKHGSIEGIKTSASDLGRWPANVIHDGSDEVVEAFPESNGQQGSVNGNEPSECHSGVHSGPRNRQPFAVRGDFGSAARFFYTSKADGDDRLGSKHPTVKPLDLMQYLVRLVTPKGGIVLDPFAGTGTTGEAAFREGMRAVLVEREAQYCEDIRRRMALILAGPNERMRESIKARGMVASPGPLFETPRREHTAEAAE